jgi:hypothetical protein
MRGPNAIVPAFSYTCSTDLKAGKGAVSGLESQIQANAIWSLRFMSNSLHGFDEFST